MKWLFYILIISSLSIIYGCEEETIIEHIPEITLLEVTPTVVKQFTDSISITIGYVDEDGDLGYANPDSFSIKVQDRRLQDPDLFYVPPLTPNEERLSIQGTLRIAIKNTFLLGNGSFEVTTYDIKIKDRLGNWSNTVTTPDITITE